MCSTPTSIILAICPHWNDAFKSIVSDLLHITKMSDKYHTLTVPTIASKLIRIFRLGFGGGKIFTVSRSASLHSKALAMEPDSCWLKKMMSFMCLLPAGCCICKHANAVMSKKKVYIRSSSKRSQTLHVWPESHHYSTHKNTWQKPTQIVIHAKKNLCGFSCLKRDSLIIIEITMGGREPSLIP